MCEYGQYTVPPPEEFVNFGVGQPSNDILPLDKIKKGFESFLNINNNEILQYGDIQGFKSFRNSLSKFLESEYECDVNIDNLFVMNGITGALNILCSLLTNKNDTIIIEEPSYFLAINIFKDYNLNIVSVPIEEDGINIELLSKEITKLKCQNRVFLYTIPSFHNPTSYTLSNEKRKKLAELAQKNNNFYILADEVYQLLYFDKKDKPPLPLYYYHPNFISIGSFSKILAPSLRLGWIQTNETIIGLLKKSGLFDSSGGISPIISAIVKPLLDNGQQKEYLDYIREELKNRSLTLGNILKNNTENNKYFEFIVPKGGYFLWIKLLNNLKSDDLLKKGNQYKIKFN